MLFGASLSEPHLVRSMAGSAMHVYMSPYVHPVNFCCGCPLQFGAQRPAYNYAPASLYIWLGEHVNQSINQSINQSYFRWEGLLAKLATLQGAHHNIYMSDARDRGLAFSLQ